MNNPPFNFRAPLGLLLAISVLALPAAAEKTSELGLLYQLNGSAIEARGLGEGLLHGFPQEPFVRARLDPRPSLARPGSMWPCHRFIAVISLSVWG